MNPPPAGLWAPAPGATPASGNYVYLQSDPGDFVGGGRTETYTQANAVLTVSESAGLLTVSVIGDRSYLGEFNVMTPLTRMEPGYYANAQRWPFGNPTLGRLSVKGDGGCNVISGWFVVDSIAFQGVWIDGPGCKLFGAGGAVTDDACTNQHPIICEIE